MDYTVVDSDQGRRLILRGRLTVEFAAQLEAAIIGTMRRYPYLNVDLSGVSDIDDCGWRLVRLMQDIGGKAVNIVAASPAVEKAARRLPAPRPGRHFTAPARGSCAGQRLEIPSKRLHQHL